MVRGKRKTKQHQQIHMHIRTHLNCCHICITDQQKKLHIRWCKSVAIITQQIAYGDCNCFGYIAVQPIYSLFIWKMNWHAKCIRQKGTHTHTHIGQAFSSRQYQYDWYANRLMAHWSKWLANCNVLIRLWNKRNRCDARISCDLLLEHSRPNKLQNLW